VEFGEVNGSEDVECEEYCHTW